MALRRMSPVGAAALLALCVSPLVSLTSALSFDSEATKKRPVSKVIALLEDMLKQLQHEADQDEETYDKFACWCETNDKDTSKAIKDAQVKLDIATGRIESRGSKSAELSLEIKGLARANFPGSLEKAKALREREHAEFNAEEKDLLDSIAALKAAIAVLSKHHSHSFLQLSGGLGTVAATLQRAMRRHADLFASTLSHRQRRALAGFVKAPTDYFDAENTFKESYAPASGEIYGILTQMLEDFEKHLSQMQKDEAADQEAFNAVKAGLEDQMMKAQMRRDGKTQQLADTDAKLEANKEEAADTRAQMKADERFLTMVREKCRQMDLEWEERQKVRRLEMEAVSKALVVLNTDEAHDLFTKTFNPSLLQVKDSSEMLLQQTQASEFLGVVARKMHSPRLSAFAASMRIDAFAKVKTAIDHMVAQLLLQKDDDIKRKDYCVEQFGKNRLETEKKEREKHDFTAKVADLKMTINALTKEVAALKAQIEEMQVQLKIAGEVRQRETKEFHETVADQQLTRKLLTQALVVLKSFYKEKKPAALQLVRRGQARAAALEVGAAVSVAKATVNDVGPSAATGAPPPPGFRSYRKSAAAGGVLGMLQQIIDDAKAMEAEAVRSEDQAQSAYEAFVKGTTASTSAASKQIVNLIDERAAAEADLVEAEDILAEAEISLEELADTHLQLQKSCAFLLKNFDLIQSARDEEIDALRQAKAILAGAKFKEFLQQ